MSIELSVLNDIVVGSHESLLRGIVPEGVIQYLIDERHLTKQIIKLFEIGFCGPELEKVINRSYYDGISARPVITADNLRDKIIIPIKDDCGKLVSIATRSIGRKQGGFKPNWWNTPFSKGNYLFGLNFARSKAFQENKLYLVEGYMDCCILHQVGLYNVAATMGVKFTAIHSGLASRYCDRLCFCYDSDPSINNGKPGAGQEAALKALRKAKNFFKVTMIELPIKINSQTKEQENSDPDEFVLQYGLPSLLALEKEREEGERYERN